MSESPSTIAAVDDDAAVRKALDRLLRGAGFDVAMFASAEEFLTRGRDCCPVCLVLDISLGGMSGLELREKLVRTGVSIPLVFITAHDDGAISRGLREAPGVPCLRKPFDEALLFEAIGAVTGESPPEQEDRPPGTGQVRLGPSGRLARAIEFGRSDVHPRAPPDGRLRRRVHEVGPPGPTTPAEARHALVST
jgi:CheY-like chemotaxis protein